MLRKITVEISSIYWNEFQWIFSNSITSFSFSAAVEWKQKKQFVLSIQTMEETFTCKTSIAIYIFSLQYHSNITSIVLWNYIFLNGLHKQSIEMKNKVIFIWSSMGRKKTQELAITKILRLIKVVTDPYYQTAKHKV